MIPLLTASCVSTAGECNDTSSFGLGDSVGVIGTAVVLVAAILIVVAMLVRTTRRR